jgi:Uma2 family endonuclease
MASQPNVFVTAEEYLDLEEKAEYKSEYMDGAVFAMGGEMAGVSRVHDIIARNIGSELHHQFKDTPCVAHTGDMRVAANLTRAYTYPDISIACKEARYIRRGTDNLLNPVAIIEVLSPSTELFDRGQKFGKYRQISSLMEYVLVYQDEILVERYARQPNESGGGLRLDGGDWLYSSLNSLDDILTFTSVPATLRLRDIYDRVFPAAEEGGSPESS